MNLATGPGGLGAASPRTGTGERNAARRPGRPAGLRDILAGALSVLERPLTPYYLILGITTLLIALGLVMVLSTSTADSLIHGWPPYAGFQHQLVGVAIGIPCLWLAARTRPSVFRAAAYPLMFVSVIGLLLVLVMGATSGGAERWLQVGPVTIQPSELAKLSFVLWGADLLARKERLR
ncbi:MAG: FtsW/RodA/SpoVE family cell cycle protein, partial [Actinobacteria bacterium]|nr:FtsW/RodA/SpoVE family cell cycle protein [Actinomycetota bacterium]